MDEIKNKVKPQQEYKVEQTAVGESEKKEAQHFPKASKMKDFLTKKPSESTDKFNPAFEIANQLRSELYEKLNNFKPKRSPK